MARQGIPPPPAPPLTRIVREGGGNLCPKCGSTRSRKYWLVGALICDQKECK